MAVKASQETLQSGDIAPGFELPGADGNTHALDEFKDRELVLIVFTCNHCPYAKAKIDELNRIAEEYEDVAVIGINPNDASQTPEDSFGRMQELVENETVRYDAYLHDEDQAVAQAYGAVCTPDPFLFANVGGSLELVYHGRLDDAMNPDKEPSTFHMRDAIEAILSGEGVEEPFRPSQGCSIKWKDGKTPDYMS
jgi:peroxiredoxin